MEAAKGKLEEERMEESRRKAKVQADENLKLQLEKKRLNQTLMSLRDEIWALSKEREGHHDEIQKVLFVFQYLRL